MIHLRNAGIHIAVVVAAPILGVIAPSRLLIPAMVKMSFVDPSKSNFLHRITNTIGDKMSRTQLVVIGTGLLGLAFVAHTYSMLSALKTVGLPLIQKMAAFPLLRKGVAEVAAPLISLIGTMLGRLNLGSSKPSGDWQVFSTSTPFLIVCGVLAVIGTGLLYRKARKVQVVEERPLQRARKEPEDAQGVSNGLAVVDPEQTIRPDPKEREVLIMRTYYELCDQMGIKKDPKEQDRPAKIPRDPKELDQFFRTLRTLCDQLRH